MGLLQRRSLGQRLLLGTLVWVLVTLGFTWWGLSALFSAHVMRQFEAELTTHLNQLAANLVFDEHRDVRLGAPMSDPRFVRPGSGLYWQVDTVAASGAAIVRGVSRSRSLWDEVLQVVANPADAAADGELHVHRLAGQLGGVRVVERVVLPVDLPDDAYRLIVAADERFVAEAVQRFRTLLGGALGVLSLGLVGAVIVQLRLALRPLARLRADLEDVHKGSAVALHGAYPDEVAPLVEAFNKVLARNAEIVQRARTQAGNLAHAVKTPLAVMANAADNESTPFAGLVREQTAAARAHIDHHLARARAAAAVQVPGMQTAVLPALEALVRVMRRVHVERDLVIALGRIDPQALFRGEEQDLLEMLGNLLDNACKWAQARVELGAFVRGDMLLIVVDDDGPGLPEDKREQAFARGVRLDERPAGSGLGLAIVRELAQLYGGDLELAASPLGGLRAALRLPAVAASYAA